MSFENFVVCFSQPENERSQCCKFCCQSKWQIKISMTLTSAIRTKLAQRTNYSLYHAPPLQRTATKVRRRTALCFSLGSVSREFIWFPYENFFILFHNVGYTLCRSQWLCGLRLRFAAARLLRSWVRIPPGSWRSVCCECCVLSGRGLCEELITRPD